MSFPNARTVITRPATATRSPSPSAPASAWASARLCVALEALGVGLDPRLPERPHLLQSHLAQILEHDVTSPGWGQTR